MIARPSRLLVAAVVQALATLAIRAADAPPDVERFRAEQESQSAAGMRPEVLETFLRMRVVAAVVDTKAVAGPIPGPTQGFVPMSWLRQRMPAQRRAWIVTRDAWGHSLRYWSDGTSYVILSLGSGGRPQFDYGVDPPLLDVPRGWAGSDPTDDLVILDGFAHRGPISMSESLRRAMSDMRATGTACESFAVDWNVYPGPVQPIGIVEQVESELEPIYIRVLPKIDPWGNPFLFWSDTRGYAIVSYGADGLPDFPYSSWGRAELEALHTGATSGPTRDIVFFQGEFLQWPIVGAGP